MTQVLIVSKTHMYNGACIGAITLPDFRSIRLLNTNGGYHPANTDMDSGQLYEMELNLATNIIEPHVENVIIESKKLVRFNVDVSTFINEENLNSIFWNGSPNNLFDGRLRWTGNGSGYISHKTGVPRESTGFWISDKDLIYNEKYYSYIDENKIEYKLKYVGFQAPVNIIPAGTKIRVSLAKWWKPEDYNVEERCYLQLSGWY